MTQDCDAEQSGKAQILVAEDDRIAQMVLMKVLEQEGYSADFVADGLGALDALKQVDYDLVLMDCFMPRMDGFEATRLIREAGAGDFNCKIPVIAMTGLTGQEDRRRCLEAGMDAYVSKPVNRSKLIPVIERCLGRDVDHSAFPQETEPDGKPPWDDAFIDTMIEGFVADIPDVIHALQRSLVCRDLNALEHIGHRLRGACDILEVPKLSARAQALEQAGKAGNLDDADTMVSELIAELERVMAVLGNPAD